MTFPRAAAVCLLLAALLSAAFAAGAVAAGKTSPPAGVAIGSGWVFTLTLIVSAPLLVPRLGWKARGPRPAPVSHRNARVGGREEVAGGR